ncbi:hypothetical protein PspLS_02145, partial [Pyricularia sp. CBS 133598]
LAVPCQVRRVIGEQGRPRPFGVLRASSPKQAKATCTCGERMGPLMCKSSPEKQSGHVRRYYEWCP